MKKTYVAVIEQCHIAFFQAAFGVILVLCSAATQGAEAFPASKWDQGLPSLKLRHIHIRQGSLEGVWRDVTLSQLGVRTVMFMSHRLRPAQNREFVFDREECTVSELLKALEEAYPDFAHTQDTNTGIIWLHPRTKPYEDILAARVKIEHGGAALRMNQDVTGGLRKLPELKLWVPYTEKNAEYPVDLPAGTYAVRDVLNICCVANPGRTFFVGTARVGEYCWIEAVQVVGFNVNVHEVSAGALNYWRTELDQSAQTPPTLEQLMETLGAKEERIRANARRYLDLTLSVYLQQQNWPPKITPFEKGVWSDIAFLGVEARADLEGAVSFGLCAPIKDALKEEDWSGQPGLKALAAMELARTERDISFLEQVAKQPLSAAEIANVKHDMIRILRLSGFLRTKLQDLKPQWAGLSGGEIEALSRTDIFSLP